MSSQVEKRATDHFVSVVAVLGLFVMLNLGDRLKQFPFIYEPGRLRYAMLVYTVLFVGVVIIALRPAAPQRWLQCFVNKESRLYLVLFLAGSAICGLAACWYSYDPLDAYSVSLVVIGIYLLVAISVLYHQRGCDYSRTYSIHLLNPDDRVQTFDGLHVDCRSNSGGNCAPLCAVESKGFL